MNKKSLVLSVLLLIGLLTPQETKPFFGVLLGVSSVVYGITFLNMFTPLNPFRTKNIADYAKEQEDIQSYKALIHIYNTKTKSSMLSIEVVDANPYNLFKHVIQHTSEFEGKKKIKLLITPTIILDSKKTCLLKPIKLNNCSSKTITKKLKKTFLVHENKRGAAFYATSTAFLFSSFIVIPLLSFSFFLEQVFTPCTLPRAPLSHDGIKLLFTLPSLIFFAGLGR